MSGSTAFYLRFLLRYLRLALGSLFLLGILLLLASKARVGGGVAYVGDFLPDLFRDVGIALIVSCVVAALFEIYRNARHQLETMSDVIDLVLGEQITREVWMDLKELISLKQAIRRHAHIRLELQLSDDLPKHQAILRVEYDYELHLLASKPAKVTVQHELDYHVKDQRLNLPRFERALLHRAGSKERSFDGTLLDKRGTNGKIAFDVELIPNSGTGCLIRTERCELVYVPGSYNLYTPEFMKGITLSIIGCPPEIDAEVVIRPQGKGQSLQKAGNTWSASHLLLPGQGIEIKFMRTTAQLPLELDAREPETRVATSAT